MADNRNKLPVEIYEFQPVSLDQIKTALDGTLGEVFGDFSVNIVDCPDLSVAPFNLPVKGFGAGSRDIVDLGGVHYLHPVADTTRNYDLVDIARNCIGAERYPNGWYFSGAGAGPWQEFGSNSEMILSLRIDADGSSKNASRVSLTSTGDEQDHVVHNLEKPLCSILGNFMVSSPEPGPVLELRCRKRKGHETNLITAIREGLQKAFPMQPIGLGGLFMVKNASTYIHIMRDFSKTPLDTEEQLNAWLKFFEFEPPMLFQSILVSHDPDLDLRVEHSHGWSLNPNRPEAGHYHHDLSGDDVEYVGYFSVAENLFRIDRPEKH